MNIFRTKNPTFVEAVVNHPSVRPTAQGGDYRLTAELALDPSNVVYGSEYGVVIFRGVAPGVYDGHIFCLSGHRGAQALLLGRAALAAIFAQSGTSLVVAAVPICLPAARYLCRRLGFTAQPLDLVDTLEQVERFKMEGYHGRNC